MTISSYIHKKNRERFVNVISPDSGFFQLENALKVNCQAIGLGVCERI